jgi:hypothetical protein
MRNQRARGITKDGLPIFSEDTEHLIVANWLWEKGLFWFHCPSGGSRNKIEAAKLKRMGVIKGVPDFIILTPPPKKLGIAHVALELKALDGKNPSPEQLEFLAAVKHWHWAAAWFKGSDAAIKWLETLY